MRNRKKWLSLVLLSVLLLVGCSQPEENVSEENNNASALGEYSEELIDLTDMTAEAVFTDVAMERNNVARGFGVDADNQVFYISQNYDGLPSDLMLNKVECVDGVWTRTEWMHAYESGYGSLDIEKDDDGKTYLWMESNGSLKDIGTSVSCVAWEDEGFIQREYGQTFSFAECEDSYLNPQVDSENDWLVLRITHDEKEPYYAFYDRSSLLEGEEPVCLYTVSCEAGQTALSGVDDSKGRYGTVTLRGFTVGGGYIYQVHGNAQGRIYIAAFDMEGNLVYCHMVKEYADMAFREPEALAYVDGKLYLLLSSQLYGDYLANVITFK